MFEDIVKNYIDRNGSIMAGDVTFLVNSTVKYCAHEGLNINKENVKKLLINAGIHLTANDIQYIDTILSIDKVLPDSGVKSRPGISNKPKKRNYNIISNVRSLESDDFYHNMPSSFRNKKISEKSLYRPEKRFKNSRRPTLDIESWPHSLLNCFNLGQLSYTGFSAGVVAVTKNGKELACLLTVSDNEIALKNGNNIIMTVNKEDFLSDEGFKSDTVAGEISPAVVDPFGEEVSPEDFSEDIKWITTEVKTGAFRTEGYTSATISVKSFDFSK
jgi:hypothetical protein